jgi:chromosome segregation ATPase
MASLLPAAEKRMGSIEERLLSLETAIGGSQQLSTAASNEALLDYQIQLLGKLKSIRTALTSEGGDVGQIKEQRDKLQTENAKLKKEIDKLNYRVAHLIKSLNAEEAKHR